MTEQLDALEQLVTTMLARQTNPTGEFIRKTISDLRQSPIAASVSESEAEQLARQLEERIDITQHIGSVLTEATYRPWLDAARADIDPYYWNRYRRLLTQQGFPPKVVSALDSVTDRVLDLLQAPNTLGRWDRRGMVIGHVQSGKTANYTGLICKAADAGYKLIVIIAGIHNNLRNQTQVRIDEGFVGRDSASLLRNKESRFVGVGRFDQTRMPATFTNSRRDFNKHSATGLGITLQNLRDPAVFVIKKNVNTLKNLIEWLREHNARAGTQRVDEPMLLIDDEADNASINIRRDPDEVSRINGQIRDLLQIFERSCYVGYTATPFANIFIDPDTDDEMLGQDLFPRSFIVSLDAPSNYFGPETVFLERPTEYVRSITDNEDHLPLVHDKETPVTSLPPSLIEALRAFVVGRAIRLARGQSHQHCSMLVNASRFVNVQRQLRDELHTQLDSIRASLRVNGAQAPETAILDTEIEMLYRTWKSEFASVGPSWPSVFAQLHEAAAPVRVVEVNGRSAGTLNYQDHATDGFNVVAVGGYSLSRGLTLEGLMVSYFLRNSMMYDTLMQMGRWFGYRPGYQDLCRIWMPEEAQGWYEHITESAEELRDEIRSMEAVGATPEEFGLKIRSHPDALIVTARNKMGTSSRVKMAVGLADKLIETHILRRDEDTLTSNRAAAAKFARSIMAQGHRPSLPDGDGFGWLTRSVPAVAIVEFLTEFRNHPGALLTENAPVKRYIVERQDDELASWDVLFPSVRSRSHVVSDNSLGFLIQCQRRTEGQRSDSRAIWVGNRQRVSTRGIEKTGLSLAQRDAAEREYRGHLRKEGRLVNGTTPNYPDWAYRAKRTRPLFVIHLIEIQNSQGYPITSDPVVAWSISFPPTRREEKHVEFVVNTTWLREHYADDLEEEEALGDNV